MDFEHVYVSAIIASVMQQRRVARGRAPEDNFYVIVGLILVIDG